MLSLISCSHPGRVAMDLCAPATERLPGAAEFDCADRDEHMYVLPFAGSAHLICAPADDFAKVIKARGSK